MNKKPALGRGLGALLGETTARQVTANAAAVAAAKPPVDELTRLPLDLLQPGSIAECAHSAPGKRLSASIMLPTMAMIGTRSHHAW